MDVHPERDQAGVLLCGAIHSSSTPPLLHAAALGNTDLLKELLQKRADLNCTNNRGRTPLHVAALQGHDEATALLLQAGGGTACAAVNAVDDNGNTPLHLAARAGHAEVVQLLLTYGADAAVAGLGGRTALHAAALNGHDRVVELLLRAEGTNVNAAAQGGYTPLHSAAYLGQQQLVRRLLQAGAKADCRLDVMSETPMHFAARRGHAAVALELLKRLCPADVAAGNRFGETSLDLAATKGHFQVVQLLLVKGGGSAAFGSLREQQQQLVRAATAAAREGHLGVWAALVRHVLLHCPHRFEQCLEGVGFKEGIKAMAMAWSDDVRDKDWQMAEVARERDEVDMMRNGAQELLVQGALLFKQAEQLLARQDPTAFLGVASN